MDYDFRGLTANQQALLTFQGWTVEDARQRVQPSPKTANKLIDRGLVIAHQFTRYGLSITEYEVPIDVHAAWCDWCSKNFKAEKVA